jgi:hypothetical protein
VLTGTTYTARVFTRPYTRPHFCATCNELHHSKTYHLDLNHNGDVIVSETVFERLKEIGMADLTLVAEVPNPPPIRIDSEFRKNVPVARREDPTVAQN